MRRIAVLVALGLLGFSGRAGAGDTLWLRIHGAGTTEAGTAVAVIGTETFVAGTVTNLDPDILLIRYRGNGDSVWSRVLNLDTTEQTVGVAVGADSAPVVCVAVSGAAPKLSLVKFNKNGDTVWTRHRTHFTPTGIAVDAQNAIFVLGSVSGVSSGESLALAKYSAGGAPLFDRAWRFGTGNFTAGCATDPAGNLIAAATIADSAGLQATLVKFSSTGDTVWRRQYPPLSGTELQGVAVAPNGCIVAADRQAAKLHIVKFAPSGNLLWNESLPGQATPKIYCNIAVDADSNILAPVTDSLQFGRVMRLNAQGQQVWSGQSYYQCQLRAIALDATGLPVAVGVLNQPPLGCLTVKFSALSAIAEPANPSVSCAERFLVRDILGPGQAIALTVPRAGSYRISILTENGALVRQVDEGNLAAGEFRFAPGRLAAGSYYLRIAGPAGTVQEKFIQLR